MLDLLVHHEFPTLYRYSKESREVLRQLRYRHKLVKLRTMVANTLHALALNAGLSLGEVINQRRSAATAGVTTVSHQSAATR